MSEKEKEQLQPAQKAQPEIPALSMPVKLSMSRFVPSVYAQHMVVQVTADAVLMTFYEVVPPVFTTAPLTDEAIEELRKTGIRAECVARITVPYNSFPEFARVVAVTAAQLPDMPTELERARKESKE
jgi:hypothetical protein